ncbi:hypothetical protein DPMN_115709 [Dreissena polymorpha]|uniref:Uncharacterized protein n=1 Tax=Dreissena polymorpha TaxID=45954 RepID=A0A9D4KLR5_DREPO|nr:hypothetical protein DPMN_115709 [Dreissena polymorpha]
MSLGHFAPPYLHYALKSSGLSQNIDRGLVNKINELVDEGVSNTDEMERRLRSHVMETENQGVFPNRSTIRNHMRKAEKIKQTSIDNETNLEGFVREDARRIITGGGCKEDNHRRRIITGGGCKADNHRRRMQEG